MAQARVGAREVVLAAVALFGEHGFEHTTMDGIAAATGVSRRSLFRRFGSKEDILFAEHDDIFTAVVRYLDASPDDPLTAVRSAARMVFRGYVRAPEITLPRYRLVRAHTRLREREVAMTARYQSAFSHYLTERAGGGSALAAGVVAASVIAAHNHVLRSWLRDPEQDEAAAWARFDEAMDYVGATARPLLETGEAEVTGTVVGAAIGRVEAGSVDAGESGSAEPVGEAGAPETGVTGQVGAVVGDAGDAGAAHGTGAAPNRVLVAVYPAGVEGDEILRRIGAALGTGTGTGTGSGTGSETGTGTG